jgi:alpha-L-fucosidase
VGNERGVAGETCWATLNRNDFVPGRADEARLNRGDRPGTDWVPAECDVSIRPGWFYHEKEDGKVRTAENLMDLYFSSVGRGASLLLNLPVDRRGRIHENDVKALLGFRKRLDQTFGNDLALGARVVASSTKTHFSPANLIDLNRQTYWTTNGESTGEVIISFAKPVTFNVVRLREYLPLGQRIELFELDEWDNGAWKPFAKGTSVGNCRLTRSDHITTTKVRLRILQSAAPAAISEIGIYSEPL